MAEVEPKQTNTDALADEPIPTYEEFVETFAKELREAPQTLLFKGVVDFVRYLFTRESLFINLLLQKEIITTDEVDTFFGPDAHKTMQEIGMKSLTRYLLNAASTGKIISATGKQINPDEILVIMNDILDLNDRGWNGKTVESVFDYLGRSNELRKTYDGHVEGIKKLNRLRAIGRKLAGDAESQNARDREERARRLRIYMAKCNVFEKPFPSQEETQQMLDGSLPIPEQP